MVGRLERMSVAAALALLGAAVWALASRSGGDVPLGEYVTSLRGRTEAQKYNARLAAKRLDGTLVPSGGSVSFNEIVGPWTGDRGYLRAPVSYDGELLSAWGGGVCQTSTTLYNAALLAGLEIVERHRHEWPPRYVIPGRDAAVAWPAIDLALRNPYRWPVYLVTEADDDALTVSVLGQQAPPYAITVTEAIRSAAPPAVVVQTEAGPAARHRVVNPGRCGFEVVVYRLFRQDGKLLRHELVSTDHYPTMDRVVRVAAGGNPSHPSLSLLTRTPSHD